MHTIPGIFPTPWFVPPILTVVILSAYAASLWWLLRREPAAGLAGVALLCGLALSLRLVFTMDYPAGLNEDEPKKLWCVGEMKGTNLFGEGCTGVPTLLTTLFQADLVPLVGANRWAMRTYSISTMVLSVAAAYAVGRSLQLAVMPSLACGAFIAVLPWALFFGRVELGGELIFHQLLMIAALARLIWANGGWPEAAMAAFNLCLLFYDYFSGRPMLGMVAVTAVLARNRRARLWCLVIPVVALLGWLPHLSTHPQWAGVGFTTVQFQPGLAESPLEMLQKKLVLALTVLVKPAAWDNWLTIRWSGVHPEVVLVLAVIGSLTGIRRSLFLWAGFLGCLLPGVVSYGAFASTHRMINAFPWISIAAGCALDLIKWRRLRFLTTVAVIGVAGVQSVMLYFSPQFWPFESRGTFDWEREAVVDALPPPPHGRMIIDRQLGYFFGAHTLLDHSYEYLDVDNWTPTEAGGVWAFSWHTAPLRTFYERLFGLRVKAFGRAFMVTLEPRDWKFLQQHGWFYEAHCGDIVRQGTVMTLYHALITFHNFPCAESPTHIWRGRWDGPETKVRLHFNGKVVVETSNERLEKEGFESWIDFAVQPGMNITVTNISVGPDPAPLLTLMEVLPTSEQVPLWDYVSPIMPDGGAIAKPDPPAEEPRDD